MHTYQVSTPSNIYQRVLNNILTFVVANNVSTPSSATRRKRSVLNKILNTAGGLIQ